MPPMFPLVPAPRELRPGPGRYRLGPDTRVVGDAAPAIAVLERAAGRPLPRATGETEGAVVLRHDPSLTTLGPEGYRLSVTPQGVNATAATQTGLTYAMVTLEQLLDAGAPCVEIEDTPLYPWRGALLDTVRHFQPKDAVLRFIDLLALHKLNTLHWHLTDDQGWRVEIRKYPRLTTVGGWRRETLLGHGNTPEPERRYDGTRHGGYYTQAEIREIVAYSAQRAVTIVPEIEMPGHATAAVAAYPELGNTTRPIEVARGWGIFDTVFNVEESTIRFLQDVLDEVMELFPGAFLHVGGDECPKTEWRQSAAAQARMRELGLANEEELQSWFIRRMDRHLAMRGRRLIGWDEILEGGLAEGAAVMSWRGEEGGVAAARAGHDVVMVPSASTYLDYYQSRETSREPLAIGGYVPLEKVYAYDPMPPQIPATHARHVLGTQGQLWSEYIATPRHLEYMAFPRLCALAEVAWLPPGKRSWPDFRARLERHLGRLDALGVNYRKLEDLDG